MIGTDIVVLSTVVCVTLPSVLISPCSHMLNGMSLDVLLSSSTAQYTTIVFHWLSSRLSSLWYCRGWITEMLFWIACWLCWMLQLGWSPVSVAQITLLTRWPVFTGYVHPSTSSSSWWFLCTEQFMTLLHNIFPSYCVLSPIADLPTRSRLWSLSISQLVVHPWRHITIGDRSCVSVGTVYQRCHIFCNTPLSIVHWKLTSSDILVSVFSWRSGCCSFILRPLFVLCNVT